MIWSAPVDDSVDVSPLQRTAIALAREASPPKVPARRNTLQETHCAWVLLIGSTAVKWKKALDLGFVDWRTVSAREHACRREVELNRQFAPDVYRDVLAVTDDAGHVRDWLVLMKRMPAARRMSTMVTGGRLVDDALRAVAHTLAAHHATARRSSRIEANGAPAALLARWTSNLDALAVDNQLISTEHLDLVTALVRDYLTGCRPLLQDRQAAGRIRDGHGDLLADDIFCLDDGPRILDCLEFDDDLRAVDGVDDAAVLAMDLERIGAPALARELMNRFIEFAADPCPPSLIHHYIAYRAVMRAKIAAIRAGQGDPDAAAQVRLLIGIGLQHLHRARPALILVGGLPGTGKTTVASDLADSLGCVLLRSDRLRKESAGVDPNGGCRGDVGLYTAERTQQTYRLMIERAHLLLGRGESVILDATWSSPEARAEARAVAADRRATIRELHCVAPSEVADARIRDRQADGTDPCDATPEVAHAMAATFTPWPEATVIDTVRSMVDTSQAAQAAVHLA